MDFSWGLSLTVSVMGQQEAIRMNVSAFLDSLARDLRQALRSLLRRPTFTFAAVLTLALGIGATTAIFSVVYSVLIKPLPYPNAGELVSIRHRARDTENLSASSNMYLTYREQNRTLASVGLWQAADATVTASGDPERVRALRVADGTLQALGVPPLLGRWFAPTEHTDAAEGPTPVILSHAFWQRRFGGEEAALGREISIESPGGNGTLRLPQLSQVVGILPPDFAFLDVTPPPDLILPVRLDLARQGHGIYAWNVLARLRPDATLAAAQTDLERMSPIWLNAWPPFPGRTIEQFADMRITPVVRPLQEDIVGGVANLLWAIMGAIGAVLLIACANVANLMLVRSDARRSELAVRAALGAVPSRIATELFAESLLLGAAGSVLGLVIAFGGLRLLIGFGPSDLPRLEEIAVHGPVLAFTVAISLAATLVFGSIPALKYALGVDAPLTGVARGSSASRERHRTRSAMVVVQVALALVLVVGAALMIRSFQELRAVDPGFADPATIHTARLFVPTAEFPDAEQYTRMQREILDRIEALPGVASAGFVSDAPIAYGGMTIDVAVEGTTWPPGQIPQTRVKFVSPGYFETMGTRLVAGRSVSWADIETGGRVAVITEDYARRIARDPASAVGQRIRFDISRQDPWREVVGVVQNVHEDGLYAAPVGMVYWPALTENLFQTPVVGTPSATFVVRSSRAGTAGLAEEILQAVRSVSASIAVAQEGTMQSLYSRSLARASFTLALLGIAGAMALALGVVGIYGVIAYVVSQRTREIGIRSALGAEPRQLKRMFLLHGLALSAVGVAIGIVVAAALEGWMSSLLFGIEPMDSAAYMAAVGIILAAAALASYLPARRAATIDPMETLRPE
jgi:putative ABC transport system permease protein